MADANNQSSELKALQLNSFYGKKVGMTRVFGKDNEHIPVTVIQLIPNYVTQVKTNEKDKYNAYQVSYNLKREKLVSNPKKVHLEKSGAKFEEKKLPSRSYEVRLKEGEAADENLLGALQTLENFEVGEFVDVTATSKGKGFQGVMKRYNFKGGPAAHGSHFHRAPGSIGNRATPSRVFPQKKMPGQMGNKRCTVQNLCIVEKNLEEGHILIKGSLPGHKNSLVKITKSIKKGL